MNDENNSESMIRDDMGDMVFMSAADGRQLAFELVARVDLEGHNYAIMLPLFDFDGKEANSVFVFKVETVNGEPDFSVVSDEQTAMAVVDEYARLNEEKNKEDDK